MPRLGRRQLRLLGLCERYGPCCSGDLTELMLWGDSENRISEMLKRLEDLGLVDDKNALTEDGREALEDDRNAKDG